MGFLLGHKEKRLAAKKYFRMMREYEKARDALERMYADLLRQRAIAGFDDDVIDRPEVYEAPEYIPGQTINKNW